MFLFCWLNFIYFGVFYFVVCIGFIEIVVFVLGDVGVIVCREDSVSVEELECDRWWVGRVGGRCGGVVGEEWGWGEWGRGIGYERCMENMDLVCKCLVCNFCSSLMEVEKIIIIEWRGVCVDSVCLGERVV